MDMMCRVQVADMVLTLVRYNLTFNRILKMETNEYQDSNSSKTVSLTNAIDEMKQKYYEWLIQDIIETNTILNSIPVKMSVSFYRKTNNILNSIPLNPVISFFIKIKNIITFKK